MDFYNYRKIRAACWQDLAVHIDTPENKGRLALKIGGETTEIQHEYECAMELADGINLSQRELCAAHLLAVVSNHFLIAWQRAPNPPDGNEPASLLERWQADELERQLEVAGSDYAPFLPEPERAALLADVKAATAAPDTSKPTGAKAGDDIDAGAGAKADNWREHARQIADKCFNLDTKNKCRDSLAGYSRRVMDEMQTRKIHGPRGLIDNSNTIQREALQGSKWWKEKTK